MTRIGIHEYEVVEDLVSTQTWDGLVGVTQGIYFRVWRIGSMPMNAITTEFMAIQCWSYTITLEAQPELELYW